MVEDPRTSMTCTIFFLYAGYSARALCLECTSPQRYINRKRLRASPLLSDRFATEARHQSDQLRMTVSRRGLC